MDPTSRDFTQWLTALARLEAGDDAHEPLERRDYLSLLLELGYNESAIEALEAQVDSLFTKATGFVQIDDFESAMPLLEDALKLAPWRCDILETLVRSQICELDKAYSATLHATAQRHAARWVDLMPEQAAPYQATKRLTQATRRHAAVRRRKLLVIGFALLGILVGTWLTLTTPQVLKASPSNASQKTEPPLLRNESPQGAKTLSSPSHKPNSLAQESDRLSVSIEKPRGTKGLIFDSAESTLETAAYAERRTGSLRLRLTNKGTHPILAMDSVVEWLDQDGQPLSSKKMVLVHKNIGLFLGRQ